MRGRRFLAAFLAVLVVGSAGAVAASELVVNHESDVAPNPETSTWVTKSAHDVGDAPTDYEGDNGETKSLNASVNASYDNPYRYTATDVNFSDRDAFPHDKSDVSAIDAGEWADSGLTSSDVETAPGVDAVRFSTSGTMTSGDSASSTFNNFTVTSDENKRMLQLVLDVESVDSAATVYVNVTDADGDVKSAVVDPDRASGEDLIGNATGEGLIYQRQLGKMDTDGSGDGNFDDVESVTVEVVDGDATLEVAGLNLEKMSQWSFGDKLADTDGDDELETTTIHETKTGGDLELEAVDSVGSALQGATINDLRVAMQFRASDLSTADEKVNVSQSDQYPAYAGTSTVYYRLSLPDAYDLGYANANLTDTQTVTSDRLMSVEYAEGTGDTNFSDISSWTDKTGAYGNEGTNVTVDDTLQPGQNVVIKYQMKLTDSELQAIASSPGGGGPMAQESGGIWDTIFGLPGAIASILGIAGIRKKFGG
ncbi:hypothetical protein G9C85_00190 [Halorubellus sp. JP-L1]|uniref:hypothetical protein n=1 Tax=Halorubellus sp. JP-L1 TaxID=2715753 RepID=UPI00140A5734|nr:hypothetical protein [Halorubellus sp. JP-L1]NHN40057.1 hypothetical protein [Halorubellus sp. JP-L1]